MLWKAGGKITSIRPYVCTINYRNHRKIVIIDGKIGYLGGMNLGNQYDWAAFVNGKDIGLRHDLRHYFPPPDTKGNIKAQIS